MPGVTRVGVFRRPSIFHTPVRWIHYLRERTSEKARCTGAAHLSAQKSVLNGMLAVDLSSIDRSKYMTIYCGPVYVPGETVGVTSLEYLVGLYFCV
jgi:hypothetical protein